MRWISCSLVQLSWLHIIQRQSIFVSKWTHCESLSIRNVTFVCYSSYYTMTILSLHSLKRQLPNSVKTNYRLFSYSSNLLAKANENPYTKTILLPKTQFPLRAEAAKREHLFKDRCTKELYPWQVNWHSRSILHW